MALKVSGNIELQSGIQLTSVYGRTYYKMNDDSSICTIIVNYYNSELDYNNGKQTIGAYFPIMTKYPYNRDTDGSDILEFTQNKIKTELESLGYSVEITGI